MNAVVKLKSNPINQIDQHVVVLYEMVWVPNQAMICLVEIETRCLGVERVESVMNNVDVIFVKFKFKFKFKTNSNSNSKMSTKRKTIK
mmetsp:Transcript_13119/g.19812  ORF Transcript_13119/g.19812 Transcript_13119/m.19812 type:complete len:88 (+) Transcript_13119:73-336(+)